MHEVTLAVTDLPDSTYRGIEVAKITIVNSKGRRAHVWVEVKSDGKGGCVAKITCAGRTKDHHRIIPVKPWIK